MKLRYPSLMLWQKSCGIRFLALNRFHQGWLVLGGDGFDKYSNLDSKFWLRSIDVIPKPPFRPKLSIPQMTGLHFQLNHWNLHSHHQQQQLQKRQKQQHFLSHKWLGLSLPYSTFTYNALCVSLECISDKDSNVFLTRTSENSKRPHAQ